VLGLRHVGPSAHDLRAFFIVPSRGPDGLQRGKGREAA
jgi:hypothetical protein